MASNEVDVSEMTRKDLLRSSTKMLQQICKKNKYKSTGNKSELIERILNNSKTKTKPKTKQISKEVRNFNVSNFNSFNLSVVNGYIHCIENIKDIPSSLTLLIIEYLSNIFMNFDIFHNDYKNAIYCHGMMIKRGNNYYKTKTFRGYDYPFTKQLTTQQCMTPFIIGCSKGFNKNRYELNIKIISASTDRHQYDCFGITKDWMEIYKTYSQRMNFENLKLFTGYYWRNDRFYKFSNKPYDGYQYEDDVKWKPNDIITFRLNCNIWKLTLKKNGKKITSTKIDKGKYHLVMLSCQPYTQYQLISYT